MANMAWAENAVIIKDNGNQVYYHPRCPHCGSVASNISSNIWVAKGTNTFASSVKCFKCGKPFGMHFGRG
ncbi:MAG: phage terminase large subunit family protein [Clostridia bacterium]|nr:phage terminase large subunit family protein [Clostridia bacterium]